MIRQAQVGKSRFGYRTRRRKNHSPVAVGNRPERCAHPLNADGPFYVADEECIACGAPECAAPMLMSHDDENGHCFFLRQPSTPRETNAAIQATWMSCCGAVRYRGLERDVLISLAELGLAERCDTRLGDEPGEVLRNRATFEFGDCNSESTCAEQLRTITRFLAVSLGKSSYRKIKEPKFSRTESVFRLEWGLSKDSKESCATFRLKPLAKSQWLLRLQRVDSGTTAGFAFGLHDALEGDQRFCHIQWFTDDEWQKDSENGRSRPY